MNDKNFYTKELLFYFKNQPHKKELKDFDYIGEANNDHCGDNIKVTLKVDKNGKIIDIGYSADGCAVSQSYMSMLAEELIGKDISVIDNLSEDDVTGLIDLDLTPSRKKCATVGLKALQNLNKKSN